jgi:uncharacterized protein (DUF2147 family)
MKLWITIMTVLLSATTAFCGPTEILGTWTTEGRDCQLSLSRCGENICGTIVWLKEPNYIDSKDGPVGKPKVDNRNPNPALRTRPILGLTVMKDLVPESDNTWKNGNCYDPETGNTYNCSMKLESPNRLVLHGYIGLSIFGRNYVLTR